MSNSVLGTLLLLLDKSKLELKGILAVFYALSPQPEALEKNTEICVVSISTRTNDDKEECSNKHAAYSFLICLKWWFCLFVS